MDPEITTADAGMPSRRTLLWASVALFLLYAASSSRERPWGDATPVFEVAENLVAHGEIYSSSRWPADQLPGRGQHYHALNPIVNSLVHLPGLALRGILAPVWPLPATTLVALSSHVGPFAAGVLTCLLFLLLCLELGVAPRVAWWSAAALAFATPVWVWARSPYTEICQTACLTGLVLFTARIAKVQSRRNALWLGVWAGLLINTKVVHVASLACAAAYASVLLRPWARAARKQAARLAGFVLLGFLPFLLLNLSYNYLRFGSWFATGYPSSGIITERWYVGLWGLLFSFGKSVLLYSPLHALTLLALARMTRRPGRLAIAIACLTLPSMMISSQLVCWSGDYAWGPRYLAPLLPTFLLPAVLLVDRIAKRSLRRRWLVGFLVGVLALCGVLVQGLGGAFYWDHFIRIAREVDTQWLGLPQKVCPAPPSGEPSRPVQECAKCFEDMYALHWLPPFQPIEGQAWLLSHIVKGDTWRTAEADGPWHRYTSQRFQIAETYARARIDWWILEFVPDHLPLGCSILGVLLLAGAACARRARRHARGNPRGETSAPP
jgi:hypothetical protein